jgi:hypothetical protein
MLAKDVVIGEVYAAKVSGKIVPVKVLGTSEAFNMNGGTRRIWDCQNQITGRTVQVRSAQRFRYVWKAPAPSTAALEMAVNGWTRRTGGAAGWDSDDGNFHILDGPNYFMLVSFKHESAQDSTFWQKPFKTARAAMEYAEKM